MRQGYLLTDGYMGWVESEHKYILFPTEQEYIDRIKEDYKNGRDRRKDYKIS